MFGRSRHHNAAYTWRSTTRAAVTPRHIIVHYCYRLLSYVAIDGIEDTASRPYREETATFTRERHIIDATANGNV